MEDNRVEVDTHDEPVSLEWKYQSELQDRSFVDCSGTKHDGRFQRNSHKSNHHADFCNSRKKDVYSLDDRMPCYKNNGNSLKKCGAICETQQECYSCGYHSKIHNSGSLGQLRSSQQENNISENSCSRIAQNKSATNNYCHSRRKEEHNYSSHCQQQISGTLPRYQCLPHSPLYGGAVEALPPSYSSIFHVSQRIHRRNTPDNNEIKKDRRQDGNLHHEPQKDYDIAVSIQQKLEIRNHLQDRPLENNHFHQPSQESTKCKNDYGRERLDTFSSCDRPLSQERESHKSSTPQQPFALQEKSRLKDNDKSAAACRNYKKNWFSSENVHCYDNRTYKLSQNSEDQGKEDLPMELEGYRSRAKGHENKGKSDEDLIGSSTHYCEKEGMDNQSEDTFVASHDYENSPQLPTRQKSTSKATVVNTRQKALKSHSYFPNSNYIESEFNPSRFTESGPSILQRGRTENMRLKNEGQGELQKDHVSNHSPFSCNQRKFFSSFHQDSDSNNPSQFLSSFKENHPMVDTNQVANKESGIFSAIQHPSPLSLHSFFGSVSLSNSASSGYPTSPRYNSVLFDQTFAANVAPQERTCSTHTTSTPFGGEYASWETFRDVSEVSDQLLSQNHTNKSYVQRIPDYPHQMLFDKRAETTSCSQSQENEFIQNRSMESVPPDVVPSMPVRRRSFENDEPYCSDLNESTESTPNWKGVAHPHSKNTLSRMLHHSVQIMELTTMDSVHQWLYDIRGSTESEPMCLLQTKPIHRSPVNLESIADTIRENLLILKRTSRELSEGFARLHRELDHFTWRELQEGTLDVCNNVKHMLSECEGFFTQIPDNVCKIHQTVLENCQHLTKALKGNEVHNGQSYPSSQVTDHMISLAQACAQFVQTIQTRLVQPLIYSVKGSASELNIIVAVKAVHGLIEEDITCKRLLLKEGVLPALFEVCLQATPSLNSVKPIALRTVSLYTESDVGRIEIERVGGIRYISQILSSPASELLKAEAAALLVQLSAADKMTQDLHSLLLEHIEVLLYDLTAIIKKTQDPLVFLVGSSAIASLTFLGRDALGCLAECEAGYVLVEGWKDGKVDSINSKDQVVTILANMAEEEVCHQDILLAEGIPLLTKFLLPVSSESSNRMLDTSVGLDDLRTKAVCERIQQKAAIGLGRLAKDKECAKEIVQCNGLSSLVDLCRKPERRNHSGPVLIACLAALRRIFLAVGSNHFEEEDIEQLIQPKLVESVLLCSSTGKESFV